MNPVEQARGVADLLALAKDIGAQVNITITLPVPAGVVDTQPAKETATMRTVMWALNLLKAAPGQPNRDLVRKFLFVKQWIGPTDEPEAWLLEHVPVTKAELATVWAQVHEFEKIQPKKV